MSDNKTKKSNNNKNNNERVEDYQAKEETTWTESEISDSDKQDKKKSKYELNVYVSFVRIKTLFFLSILSYILFEVIDRHINLEKYDF